MGNLTKIVKVKTKSCKFTKVAVGNTKDIISLKKKRKSENPRKFQERIYTMAKIKAQNPQSAGTYGGSVAGDGPASRSH